MLANGIRRVVKILKSDAVSSFKSYWKTYRHFAGVVNDVIQLIKEYGLEKDPHLRKARRSIEKLLRTFFSEIEEFEGHLGPKRDRNSFFNAIAKIRWTSHVEPLKELRLELDRKLGGVYLLIATKPR